MLATAFVAFANHVLDPAPWAREKLSAHAGKTALFDVFPARLAIAVAADGKVQPAPPEALPAVTIRLTHLTLLEVLAGGEEAWRKAEISGDTDFAAVISQVVSNLRWDVEEDLSRVVGDVERDQVAAGGQHLAELHEYRPECFQREAQTLSPRPLEAAPEQQPRSQQAQPAHPGMRKKKFVQPETQRDVHDLEQPQRVHDRDGVCAALPLSF